jgi:DNA polymerase elongation subunit (family B)
MKNGFIYTNVAKVYNKIVVSGYDKDGFKQVYETENIPELKLFTEVKKETGYTNITKTKNFYPKNFESIKEYDAFLKEYQQYDNYDIYGIFPLEKKWISANYGDDIKINPDYLNVGYYDIETMADCIGLPNPQTAPKRITGICLYCSKRQKYYVLADKPFKKELFYNDPEWEKIKNNIKFHEFTPDFVGEFKMLKLFCHIINNIEKVDILSGWNSDGFDYPYVYNRIVYLENNKKLYPEVKNDPFCINDLSPFGSTYKSQNTGKLYTKGIQFIDYMQLYLKYTDGSKESFSLDFISNYELGDNKIKYKGSIHDFYTNEYDTYVYYNFHDTRLVKRLDDKLKFMILHCNISYLAHQNFEDAFSPVATWESIFYNYLYKQNIILDLKEFREKQKFLGAYTHNPIKEFYNYLVSFDLNSLYPHLIMQYFISPENILSEAEVLDMFPNNPVIKELLEIRYNLEAISNTAPYDKVATAKAYDDFADLLLAGKFDLSFLEEKNITMTPSIEFFRKNENALMPYFMKLYYDMRKKVKKDMLKMENEISFLESVEGCDHERIKEMEMEANILDIFQRTYKTLLNSGYGAMGNVGFVFFDLRLAKSITASGRLAIRSLIKTIEDGLSGFYEECSGKKYDNPLKFFVYSDTDSCVGSSVVNTDNYGEISIENLYEKIQSTELEYKNEQFVKNITENIKSLSVNNNCELEYKNIKYIMKHKVKKELFLIFIGEKKVVITKDHSLIVCRDNKLTSVKPEEVLINSDLLVYLDENKKIQFCIDYSIVNLGECEEIVYDIEVEDNHNFFANDILIHNSVYMQLEPIIPFIINLYKKPISYFVNKNFNYQIPKNYFENILENFENKNEITTNYFTPNNFIKNGLAEEIVFIDIDMKSKKEFEEKLQNNNIVTIYKRKNEKSYLYMIDTRDIENIKSIFKDSYIKYIGLSSILDDFCNIVIQNMIDDNYTNLAKLMNSMNKMVMKRECICKNGCWLASKNYMLSVINSEGVQYSECKIKIKGVLKTIAPGKAREKVKKFIEMMLNFNDPREKQSKKHLNDFALDFEETFYNLPYNEICINKRVNDIDKWIDDNTNKIKKGAQAHIYGAIVYNEYIEENQLREFQPILERDKVKNAYLIQPNPFESHTISFKGDGLPEEFIKYVDYNKMINIAYYDLINVILNPLRLELDFQRHSEDIMDLFD